ncbi:hypothetical protein TNCT_573351 [Trichonephila clavata]|uniref:Uncharacterized protein n=1 Tax=Trichonephila clavata TaxID=2740835 RepID=A0A8X6LBW6_TRICU|nr:hypothetical protein TNCT_573351 [Trichonephila clavata]
MPRSKRKNNSSKLNIQKRGCTETITEDNMAISKPNSNVSKHSCGDSSFKNESFYARKSVQEQENVSDNYDGPSYIITDKNALRDIFKYTLCRVAATSQLST